ncbi:hypothetical protein QUB60_14255 [Microcoleus sp. A2-C5]|uniref:hypothetical protein n=1 Tax=Microcoleaceae TaxID=1892252 RepID=UPI002237D8C9|nr:hypothetical protein [Lyngbya sp. CCAP 1446/10]MCW6052245.1 hypothetical protein [Lyngbya sp. CCAP 1446/10]
MRCASPYKPIALAPVKSRGRNPRWVKGRFLVAKPLLEPRHRVFGLLAFFEQAFGKKLEFLTKLLGRSDDIMGREYDGNVRSTQATI